MAIISYTPSQADVHVYTTLKSAPDAKYPHTVRWYNHIASYAKEHGDLAGSSNPGQKFTKAAAASKEAAADDDDDDIDLFGEDEEEDAENERIKAERVKAYEAKKANKPKAAAKVIAHFSYSVLFLIVFIVCCHPWGQALGRWDWHGRTREERPCNWARRSRLG